MKWMSMNIVYASFFMAFLKAHLIFGVYENISQ